MLGMLKMAVPYNLLLSIFLNFHIIVVFTQYTFEALNGLLCTDVPLRNYSLRATACSYNERGTARMSE